MNEIGLFEAKTKFSEICENVAAKREAVVITRRGKPLVSIRPIPEGPAKSSSVWDRRAKYVRRHGNPSEKFVLPRREKQNWRNPFEG